MTSERIGKETLEKQLPAILREQLQRDGMPANHLPSWRYITANTRYSAEGLNIKCKKLYNMTLHELLEEQGFGVRTGSRWPTTDEPTVQSLEYFINSIRKNRDYKASTIQTVKSTISKVYEAMHEENIETELLHLGRCDSHDERLRNIQYTIDIIEYMDQTLADSTMQNYPYYFSEYYKIVKNAHRIDMNPVEHALTEFDWVRSRGDCHTITEEQLAKVWNTLNGLEECPVEGYDLAHWRMWLKILIVFVLAVGPRSNELVRFDIQTQLHFGDDPHVHFDERKNLRQDDAPERVPLMMGTDYLRAYRDYINETDGNGSLVPSPQAESGCRTADTLNSWLKRVCMIADVRLPDGTLPTIQNFRQLWKTEYLRALHKNRDHIKFVAEEGGTDDHRVDEENYIDDIVNRQNVRELARDHFEGLLDISGLPAVMQKEIDQTEYGEQQSTLSDY